MSGTSRIDLRGRLLSWRAIGSIVLGVALLVLLFRVVLDVDLAGILDRLGTSDLRLLAGAFVAHYLTFPLRTLRWRYLMGRAGMHLSFRAAIEIFSVGWFVNTLAPARLGDAYRVYLVRGEGADVPRTTGTLVVERVADVVVVFILASVAGYWSFRGRLRPELEAMFLIGLALAVALVLLLVGMRTGGGFVSSRLPRSGSRLWEAFRRGTLASLSPRAIGVVGLLTAVTWVLEGARLFLVVGALGVPEFGIGVSAAIFAALIGAFFSLIPITPAGIGYVEAGLIYALSFYGVPTSVGAGAAILDRTITVLSVLFFGAILYLLSPRVRREHT